MISDQIKLHRSGQEDREQHTERVVSSDYNSQQQASGGQVNTQDLEEAEKDATVGVSV